MIDNELQMIATTFRELAGRFEQYADRSVKPSHLARHIKDLGAQAGRLFVQAIDAKGFPKGREEQNRGWWNQQRLPWGSFGGDSRPLSAKTLRTVWTFAVGSWLVNKWPERFRDGAAKWDWWCAKTDQHGRPLGKDGKPLKGRWFRDGEPLPDDFEWTSELPPDQYSWRLLSEIAGVTDGYDNSDWLDHLGVRAEVKATACRLLAEMIDAKCSDEECPSDLIGLNKATEVYHDVTGSECSDDTIRRRTQGEHPLLTSYEVDGVTMISEAEVRKKAWQVKKTVGRRRGSRSKPAAE